MAASGPRSGASMVELIAAAFNLYRSRWRLVLALTVPIVVIVAAITSLGLGDLTANYDPGPPVRDAYIQLAADQLVTVPLISAILARLVVLTRAGEPVVAADLLAGALEAFPAVLVVIVIWLGVSILGLVTLILPGIYVFVSWYFVVQAVVVDGQRGLAPISRSAALVRGRWWQSAGVGIGFQLVALVPRIAVSLVFTALASAANAYSVEILGAVVIDALTLPFVAIGATLYYLQLRATAAGQARA